MIDMMGKKKESRLTASEVKEVTSNALKNGRKRRLKVNMEFVEGKIKDAALKGHSVIRIQHSSLSGNMEDVVNVKEELVNNGFTLYDYGNLDTFEIRWL